MVSCGGAPSWLRSECGDCSSSSSSSGCTMPSARRVEPAAPSRAARPNGPPGADEVLAASAPVGAAARWRRIAARAESAPDPQVRADLLCYMGLGVRSSTHSPALSGPLTPSLTSSHLSPLTSPPPTRHNTAGHGDLRPPPLLSHLVHAQGRADPARAPNPPSPSPSHPPYHHSHPHHLSRILTLTLNLNYPTPTPTPNPPPNPWPSPPTPHPPHPIPNQDKQISESMLAALSRAQAEL
jgi:hypothetical protein